MVDVIKQAETVRAKKPAIYENWLEEQLFDAVESLLTLAKDQEAEIARLDEQVGMSITVGAGLSVHGSGDAIRRVQNYILLDSAHPVEREDVRRSLARALQNAEDRADKAEAEIARLKAPLGDEGKAHVLALNQCAMFVMTDYSEPIARGMTDAAAFIEHLSAALTVERDKVEERAIRRVETLSDPVCDMDGEPGYRGGWLECKAIVIEALKRQFERDRRALPVTGDDAEGSA